HHVEGNRDPRHAVRAEPLVGEPEVRPEAQAARLQLAEQLGQAVLEAAALDPQAQVAQPEAEQPLVVPVRPGGLRGYLAAAPLALACARARSAGTNSFITASESTSGGRNPCASRKSW